MSEATQDPPFDFDADTIAQFEGVEDITKAITQEGYTPGDFLDIDARDLDAAYAQGCMLLNQGQYDKAAQMFKVGAYLDHYDERFWLGLGVARQLDKKYMSAVNAFATVANLTPENPIASLRAAECLIAADKPVEAEQALQCALVFCEGIPEHAETQQRAEALLESLSS